MGKKFFIEVNMLENNKIESKVITDLTLMCEILPSSKVEDG